MDEEIVVNGKKYEIVKNYRDAFEEEEFLSKCTDYFDDFDYIVGDIAYGKLRLKGFYADKNKKAKKLNKYSGVSKYLKDNCANDCRYFIVKRSDK